jgi:hypothetical protein
VTVIQSAAQSAANIPTLHAGFVRDHFDEVFKLFDNRAQKIISTLTSAKRQQAAMKVEANLCLGALMAVRVRCELIFQVDSQFGFFLIFKYCHAPIH